MQNPRQNGSDGACWLVLGATGFVGNAVMRELNRAGRQAADEAVDVFEIHQVRSLIRKLQPTILLNATGHPRAMAASGLKDFYVRSLRNILEAVKAEQPACRVILLGSAAEYGNTPATGARETDARRPLSEYGRAKCEQFDASCQFAESGTDVITACLFNVFGPGQRKDLFPQALFTRIRTEPAPVRVDCGNHIRDWIDIRDVVQAIITAAGSPLSPKLLNVCTGQGGTVASVAQAASVLSGTEVVVAQEEISPEKLWRSTGNPEKIFELGWRPRFNLMESLAGQWKIST